MHKIKDVSNRCLNVWNPTFGLFKCNDSWLCVWVILKMIYEPPTTSPPKEELQIILRCAIWNVGHFYHDCLWQNKHKNSALYILNKVLSEDVDYSYFYIKTINVPEFPVSLFESLCSSSVLGMCILECSE